MSKHNTWLAIITLSYVSGVFAQNMQIPDWENSVRFELVASHNPVRPGDSLEVGVMAEIQTGFHLFGPEEKKPNRTEVEVSGDWVDVDVPRFPPVVSRDLSGIGTYDLYEGEISILIPISVHEVVSDVKVLPIDVKIKYQICTDFACSAPTSKTLSLDLSVVAEGGAGDTRQRGVFNSKE